MKYKRKTKPANWMLVHARPAPKRRVFKPIKRSTSKRAAELRRYSVEAKAFLEVNDWCYPHGRINPSALFAERSTQIHHSHGRVGSLLIYKPWWVATCATCHRWIEDNKAAARSLGLICELGQWNVPPKEL